MKFGSLNGNGLAVVSTDPVLESVFRNLFSFTASPPAPCRKNTVLLLVTLSKFNWRRSHLLYYLPVAFFAFLPLLNL